MKILAVDDDPQILEVLRAVLNSHGYDKITTCGSAEEALRQIQRSQTRFDCIFLDIVMDVLDGIELCRNIRALPGYEATPIIMLTAKRDKASVDAAFRAGATDYVTKPFDIVELGARVRVAKTLVRAQAALATQQAGPDKAEPVERARFDEVYPIEGPDTVIEFEALENYVRQLRSSKIRSASVFGIRFEGMDLVLDQCERSESLALLAWIASVQSEILSSHGSCFIAYAGQGTFVCVLHSESRTDERGIEDQLQDALNGCRDGALRDRMLKVVVGAPLTSMSGKTNLTGRALRVAFARVQARISARTQANPDW